MTSMPFMHSHPQILLENVGDDKETFLQLAEIFRRESVSILTQMRESCGKSDLVALGRQSHSLKGTVGPLGADQLVQMLLDIEDDCVKGKYVCNEKQLAQVEDELRMVGSELTSFIEQF